jgi:hypothetical protein
LQSSLQDVPHEATIRQGAGIHHAHLIGNCFQKHLVCEQALEKSPL